jgi:hypothetical protein
LAQHRRCRVGFPPLAPNPVNLTDMLDAGSAAGLSIGTRQ